VYGTTPPYTAVLTGRYFLNLLVDCTIGVPILWVNLKILHRICRYLKLKGTRSGDYGGVPPKWTWWLKQVVVYCIGVCWMKIGTLVVLGSLPYLDKIGEWLVGWTKGNITLQIIIVMFVCALMKENADVDIAVGVEYFTVFDRG
jgi:hypothetical protein